MLSLADSIIREDTDYVRQLLRYEIDPNQIDEYGFTPLIEAAIAENVEIATLLIEAGADVNLQDAVGSTPLHWATENNNLVLAELLLKHGANPNAYSLSGQPVMVMPLLRGQKEMKKLLINYGGSINFAQDFVNVKSLGHLFELIGTANILSPEQQFVEVDFEGFYLEITLGMITDALLQYKGHYASRQMRRFHIIMQHMISTFSRAAKLIKYQQYRVDVKKFKSEINSLIEVEPLIIPMGYEGHAITFVKMGDIFVKCDRREGSRLYDNIMVYRIHNIKNFSTKFVRSLIFKKQTSQTINKLLPEYLALEPITEIKVAAQISGNCSWANVEACIPVLMFLLSSGSDDFSDRIAYYKSVALNFFHQWREWYKDRALHFCIDSFQHTDPVRKACKAELLAAILFQRLKDNASAEHERIEAILKLLMHPKYKYILENYVRSYYYEKYTEEGKYFLNLLENYGFKMGRSR